MISNAIIRILPIGITVFFLLGNASNVALGEIRSEFRGIQLSFAHANAVLTTNELSMLLVLAKAQGINDVAKIETAYAAPSTRIAISVLERERIDGRLCQYRVLEVQKDGWSPSVLQEAKRIGPFWVGPDALSTRILTLFKISDSIIRVSVTKPVPLSIADQLVKALHLGRVRFSSRLSGHSRRILPPLTDLAMIHSRGETHKRLEAKPSKDGIRRVVTNTTYQLCYKMDEFTVEIISGEVVVIHHTPSAI